MNVDFNNLRTQACHKHDELIELLNGSILKEDEYLKPPGWNNVTNIKGFIVVDSDELADILDDLRTLVSAIALTHEDNREDFKDVYPKDRPLAVFKYESEEGNG